MDADHGARMDFARDPDRIEALYERARALPAAERAAFLISECDDAEVRAEIESLLEGAAEAESMFSSLLEAESRIDYARELSRDVRIGGYRIVRRLGAGGMGTVYLARRSVLGIEQQVAIKIVRPGHADPKLETRLLQEGRVLARLDHPGIARFIDGGLTPDGLPFFAMEYVDGIPLLEYCERESISTDRRLRLFLAACDAVQYAHRQLVVHRDLKPAHILVESGARVRLLDFGVARILDPGDAPASMTDVWVTPSYASPEQIRGLPIDTATDQYSLGVILYELLAGSPPYRLAGRTPAEIERIVCDEPIHPPSRAAAGRPLARRLEGDLDNIVLKAMDREPARRYDTVARLADDLRDHLANRPVSARPATWRYRTGRYIRRNRTAVAAAAIVFLALVSGTAVATWQAGVATAERDRAREALRVSEQVRTFITELFWTDHPAGSRASPAPGELLSRAARQAQDPALGPAVRAELLDVLGWASVITADFAGAGRMLEEAALLRRALHPEGHPDLAITLSRLSAAQRRLGQVQRSEATAREALDMQEQLLGPDHPHVAETLTRLGQTLILQHRPGEAIDLQRRALDIHRTALDPADPALVGSLHSLAGSLLRVGAEAEAEALFREALAMEEAVRGRDHARVGDAALALGGFLAGRGRAAEAETLYARALAIHEAAYEDLDERLTWPLTSLGGLLVERGDRARGFALLRRALAIQRRSRGDDHLATASTMASLASAYRSAGRFAEAESLYWEVLAIERANLGPRHPQTAGSLLDIGVLRIRRGDLDGALPPMLEGLSIRREDAGTGTAGALEMVADLYRRRGEYERAEALLQEGLAVANALPLLGSTRRDALLRASLELYTEWGRPDQVARIHGLLNAADTTGRPP